MCNLFDKSCLNIISKFNEKNPKSIMDIINAFGKDEEEKQNNIIYLELYGDSLSDYIRDLDKHGYLNNQGSGYILSSKGLRKLDELQKICASSPARIEYPIACEG